MIILDELISSIDKDSDIKTSELLKNISNNKIIVLIGMYTINFTIYCIYTRSYLFNKILIK